MTTPARGTNTSIFLHLPQSFILLHADKELIRHQLINWSIVVNKWRRRPTFSTNPLRNVCSMDLNSLKDCFGICAKREQRIKFDMSAILLKPLIMDSANARNVLKIPLVPNANHYYKTKCMPMTMCELQDLSTFSFMPSAKMITMAFDVRISC